MKRIRQLLWFTGALGAVIAITSCTYDAAVQGLTPAERDSYPVYSKVMTAPQARTYLSKATAAERTAYLKEIGITQRFQNLQPQDRAAVLARQPRQGMSAESLYFLWGEPYYTEGYRNHHEYWYYVGTTPSLANDVISETSFESMVQVYLVDGEVVWWHEFVPNNIEGGEDDRSRP